MENFVAQFAADLLNVSNEDMISARFGRETLVRVSKGWGRDKPGRSHVLAGYRVAVQMADGGMYRGGSRHADGHVVYSQTI